MFTDPDATGSVFPKLKCKGNESRYVLLALLGVLRDPLVVEETPYAQSRLACVLYLCRFYAICDTPEYHLSVDEATEASKCSQAFLDHYCCLCQWAIDNGKMM